MLLIVSIINTAELYSTFKYHMKIGETTRCCSFFLRTHVKISSKISIIEFNIQIKWCIIVTPSREAEKDYQGYFNSPPHKKNHIATTMINTVLFKISTHIFTKRMTAFRLSLLSPTIFQLTSSRRGWPSYKISFECHFHFNSHPHEEDDLTNEIKILSSIYFNSHPHEEDDNWWPFPVTPDINFNSHPHEEDDLEFQWTDSSYSISTHILTKRMTEIYEVINYLQNISTHILTKRMTLRKSCDRNTGHISTHILTKRMTIWNLAWKGQGVISTHILTKRMTSAQTLHSLIRLFQLTSSRRGWQKMFDFLFQDRNISTHILTKRMTA